ncbi:uncharacterized protein LOC129286642 [Prosopis cineraria]|uniref:uncharacterized protein LOC129286642 n=1 Tax=Prosopis cineraria TaxID=364024 RepID=UPI00240FAF71|nr:uncharacterized protein LOC129286642 [Prosopis cineraria]
MSFGLKNAGVTYQRARVALFHDMIHKEIEVYVDDMVAKSTEDESHVVVLQKLFKHLRKYKLRLNPNICIFGASSGKLLGFIVSKKGIEVDLDKVKAIRDMRPPQIEKEVHGRVSKWQVILSKYDVKYITRKPIKGSIIADYLEANPMEEYQLVNFQFPGEDVLVAEEEEQGEEKWKMYFDRAVNIYGNGLRVVLALKELDVFRDSALVIYQATVTLAVMVKLDCGIHVQPIRIEAKINPAYCLNVENEMKAQLWFLDIKGYIKSGEYPLEAMENDKKTIRHMAMNFFLSGDVLYKRTFDDTLLRCVDSGDARKILEEIYEGICGTHAYGHTMAKQVQRHGYFWLIIETDCINMLKSAINGKFMLIEYMPHLNRFTTLWPLAFLFMGT